MSTKTEELVNIAAHLPRMAEQQPDTVAVAFPAGGTGGDTPCPRYTYLELDTESDRLARGLLELGIGRGMRTVLMVKPGLDFFALTFALFKMGAVPVMVDPGLGVKNLGICLGEARPEAFIGIPRAHVARVAFGWARATIRHRVTVGRRLFWRGKSLEQVRRAGTSSSAPTLAATQKDETAAILFTSGSTGVPKGAVYTHGNFTAQVEMLRQTYGIEPGEVDLPTFPLFALFAPALGMTAVIPEMDFTRPARVDPARIFAAIERFGVTTLFGSPALLDTVSRRGDGVRLPTLRRVLSAGAPVHASILERFTSMLEPGTQVFTSYGATESLPVCSIGSDEILQETRELTARGYGVCVGRPVEGARVDIIRIDDGPIPMWSDDLLVADGDIGEIAVRGAMVTREYYRRPESTALAKMAGPDGEVVHRMGDLGYRDERGRIWFCGRKSQRVTTSRGTLFTIPCEGVFNAHPSVYRTALVGIPRGGDTEPALCVELEPDQTRSRSRIRAELLELGSRHKVTESIRSILFHSAFPVDIRHNAKIFRERLAVWAARGLSS